MSTESTSSLPENPYSRFIGLRISGITSFGVVIIAFFFTFCEISCGKNVSYTGMDIAFGRNEKIEFSASDLFPEYKQDHFPPKAGHRSYYFFNVLALGGWLCAIMALLLTLLPDHRYAMLTAITGLTGTISLLALKIDLKNELLREFDTLSQFFSLVSVRFMAPFWISMFVMFAGAFISFLRWKEYRRELKPPADNW